MFILLLDFTEYRQYNNIRMIFLFLSMRRNVHSPIWREMLRFPETHVDQLRIRSCHCSTIQPCENMTERNPYNEDLAWYHADTLRLGRATDAGEKKHVLARSWMLKANKSEL